MVVVKGRYRCIGQLVQRTLVNLLDLVFRPAGSRGCGVARFDQRRGDFTRPSRRGVVDGAVGANGSGERAEEGHVVAGAEEGGC